MRRKSKKIKVLISEASLKKRMASLAKEIHQATRGQDLVVVGVLKGAFVFMSDLIRHLTQPVTCDFLRISSYDARGKPRQLRLEFDLTQPIANKHVLVVEDIVDTGSSLQFIREHLLSKKPKSLKICALLKKETEKMTPVEFIGFTIKNLYVVGYGMDLNGQYRHLPYLGYLAPK